jgi:hypothetical protein
MVCIRGQGWPGRRAPPRSRLRGSFRTRRASDRGCTRQSRWRPRRASRRRAGLRRAGDGRPDPRRQGSHRRGRVPHRSGSEYTARAFRTACERIGIKQSMGRPGSALDKACVSHCTSSRELGISRACASKWVNRGAWDSSRPNAAARRCRRSRRVTDLPVAFLFPRHQKTVNPIARELRLTQIMKVPRRFKLAQSNAADHFARHFASIGGPNFLERGAEFVEAKYHLLKAGRESEFEAIASDYRNLLLRMYGNVTRLPAEQTARTQLLATLIGALSVLIRASQRCAPCSRSFCWIEGKGTTKFKRCGNFGSRLARLGISRHGYSEYGSRADWRARRRQTPSARKLLSVWQAASVTAYTWRWRDRTRLADWIETAFECSRRR